MKIAASPRLSLASALVVASLVCACGSTGLDLGGGKPSPATSSNAAPTPPIGNPNPELESFDWNGNWEWLAPQLTGQTLRAAWAAAPDDIWIVGDGGTVIRWNGAREAKVVYQGPVNVSYSSIVGTSTNDVWIGGNQGALHYNGTSFSESVNLGSLPVRSLKSCRPGSYIATTTDGSVWGRNDAGWTWYQIRGSASRVALDVVCAPGGNDLYVLDATGVDLIRNAYGAGERVVSFSIPTYRVVEGAFVGTGPDTFQYVFGQESSPASNVLEYAYYASRPGTVTARSIDSVSKSQASWGSRVQPLLAHVDDETLVMHLSEISRVHLLEKGVWRSTSSPDARTRFAFRHPSRQILTMGERGYVAEVQSVGFDQLTLAQRLGSDMSELRRFKLARDGSAWGTKFTRVADRAFEDSFAPWDEAAHQWQWQTVPPQFSASSRTPGTNLEGAAPGIQGMAPLSRTSVWFVLRRDGDKDPKWSGGSNLAHWNGHEFDRVIAAPQSLDTLAADGEGGFFALASDGTLFRADKDAAMTRLADAGTAGDGLALCRPGLTPIAGGKTWTLDALCTLSLWDGSKLVSKPSIRTSAHGSGNVEFALWASSADSLWILDPFRGLVHLQGNELKLVYSSDSIEAGEAGIWGADESHIWFADRGALYGTSGRMLRMWDGATAKAVIAAPNTWAIAGGKDAAWFAGSALMRLKATSTSQPAR